MDHDPADTADAVDAVNTASAEQLPAAVDYTLQSPISDSSNGKKRHFEKEFDCLSPDRDAKRFRSRSPPHPTASQNENNNEVLDNNSVTVRDGNATVVAGDSCEKKQAQPILPLDPILLQGTSTAESNTLESHPPLDDDVDYLLELSCNGTRGHFGVITKDTPKDNVAMIRTVFPSDNMPIDPVRLGSEQTLPQDSSSPLSELSSHPSSSSKSISLSTPSRVISTSTAAVPSTATPHTATPPTAIGVELQNNSTQTEPTPVSTHNDTLDNPVSHRHSFSNHELWERELESIRRSQPLVIGSYTRVNVPLREIAGGLVPADQNVEVFTADAVMNSHDFTSNFEANPKSSLRSGTITGRDYGYKNCEIISLSDTDDEENVVPKYNSRIVGGGGFIYSENGGEFVPSDEEEEEEEGEGGVEQGKEEEKNPIHGRHRCNQSNENVSTIDDLPDYEDSGMDEEIRKEEPRSSNQFVAPRRRYDDHNTSDDDYDYNNADYQDNQRDNCALKYDDVVGTSRSENSGRAIHEHATPRYGRNSTVRERSRSPNDPRGRSSEKRPHRENRHHSNRYTNDARQRYIRDKPENISFYGYSPTAKLGSRVKNALRYQDRFSDVGEVPGPKSGLRLKLDDYVDDVGSDVEGLEQDINRVMQETFYASETLDEEQALQETWASQSTKLFKGFPLVEEIGFVTVGNRTAPEGDCYWRALAYTLHGKPDRWDIIKADHLAYLRHVLSDKTHPRHQLYVKLNTQFFETNGGVLKRGGHATRTPSFKANIWQLLHMPHSWTPGVMQQITADLYNIYLVTFKYDYLKNMCSEVSIRGVYNSRHCFMLFTNDCHFQPLAVNEYLT
ncbi:hypothetical protein F5Y12DRAFT_794147 [Xylaria sp. FL1777]|nr:hypothetical protein F5Y12DRAFT_794147 [Xylaria sp. FL1777]